MGCTYASFQFCLFTFLITMLVQVPAVAGRYDAVLRTDVAHAQQARQLQAAFAAEGRAWTDVLVDRSAVDARRTRIAEVDQLAGGLSAQVDDPSCPRLSR